MVKASALRSLIATVLLSTVFVAGCGSNATSKNANPTLPTTNLDFAAMDVQGPIFLQGLQLPDYDVPCQAPRFPLPGNGTFVGWSYASYCPDAYMQGSGPKWASGSGFTITDRTAPLYPQVIVPDGNVAFSADISFTDDTSAVQFTPKYSDSGKPISSSPISFMPGVLEGDWANYTLTVQRWDSSATTCPGQWPSQDPDYPDGVRFDVPNPTAGTGCWVDWATSTIAQCGPSVYDFDRFLAGNLCLGGTAGQNGTVKFKLLANVTPQAQEISTYVRYVVIVSEGDKRVPGSSAAMGWGPEHDSNCNANSNLMGFYRVCSDGGYFTNTSNSYTNPQFPTAVGTCTTCITQQNFYPAGLYRDTIHHPTNSTNTSFIFSEALNPFHLLVLPQMMAQLKVLPYSLLYQPPGNNSSMTYTTTQSYGITFGTDTKSTNNKSTTIDNKDTSLFGYGDTLGGDLGKFLGVGLGLGSNAPSIPASISLSYENSTAWDKSTKTGTGTTSDVSTSQSSSEQYSLQFKVGPNSRLIPGTSPNSNHQQGTYANAPFMSDRFELLTHPQFGFWEVEGAPYIAMLAADGSQDNPTFMEPTVADLDACKRQVAPFATGIAITGTSDRLNSNDCSQLLSLDPFYGVGQNPPSFANDPRAIPSSQLNGTQYGTDYLSGGDLSVTLTHIITHQGATASTAAVSYNGAVTDVLTTQQTEGANLSFYGFTGKTSFQTAETQTSSTDWSLQLQTSTQATAQNGIMYTGTLDDKNTFPSGYLPSAVVYQDGIFGTYLFVDPCAPDAQGHASPAPECA